MLSEEALIFLGGLAALGGVALGVMELLWPTRPRRAERRVDADEPPPAAARTLPEPPAVAPAARRRWRSSRPRHALNGSRSPYRRRDRTDAPAEEPGAGPPEGRGAAAPPPAREPQASVAVAVDRCLALAEHDAHAEVVATATAALDDSAGAATADVARLWSLAARAHHALGDRIAARAALESAIVMAPADERPAYQRQLAALAAEAAQALVLQAESVRGPSTEEHVAALREALDWLERGAAVAPADATLVALADDVERRVWPSYERVVMALVQRQHYADARRLLREALGHPRFPAARGDAFRDLLSGTFGGEIGQLTALAIRSMHDAREADALGALERAERLLESIHDDVLTANRREEVDRRLWWGYKKLGRRRVQAGEYEAAADALTHALRFAGVGTERQAETRAALVRALEGLVEQRGLRIRELAAAGDHGAAALERDALWSRLRAAVADGLGEPDLAVAFATAQRVVDEAGVRP